MCLLQNFFKEGRRKVERMRTADCWPTLALIWCVFLCWKWKHFSSGCQNITTKETVTTEMRTTIINYPEEGPNAARTPACLWPSLSVSSLWPGSWRKMETHSYQGLAVIRAALCSPWHYKLSTFVPAEAVPVPCFLVLKSWEEEVHNRQAKGNQHRSGRPGVFPQERSSSKATRKL